MQIKLDMAIETAEQQAVIEQQAVEAGCTIKSLGCVANCWPTMQLEGEKVAVKGLMNTWGYEDEDVILVSY